MKGNPVRQIGRWPDTEWKKVQRAAKRAGLTTAEYCRRAILAQLRKDAR